MLKNLICSSPCLNWFRRNSLLNGVSQYKIVKKFIKTPILASKVIEFGVNREPVYDFLLVININLYALSRTVIEIQRLIGLKSHISPPPLI